MTPLVTISILSYNRLDDLKITFAKLSKLKYKNVEIIVLDQGSTDGTWIFLNKINDLYPKLEIRTIICSWNLGIAGGRQNILTKAKGDFILTLDDDSYPDPHLLNKAIMWFMLNPKLGAIGCNLLKPNDVYNGTISIPTTLKEPRYDMFTGSGAIIRREAIPDGWDSAFMYSCEDTDLSLQILRNGWYIANIPDLVVTHAYATSNRSYNHKIERFAEGYVRRSIKYLPNEALKRFYISYTADAIKYGVLHKTLAYLKPLFKIRCKRTPLTNELFNNILLPYKDLFGYYRKD